MADRHAATVQEPGFYDLLPDRLAVFAVGLIAGAGVGLLVGAMGSVSVPLAFGYTLVVLGTACTLGGGLRGGGYGVYGVGDGLARNHYMRGDGNRLVTEGLRHGYDRPRANPEAFGQVMAGVLYIAIGILAIVLAS